MNWEVRHVIIVTKTKRRTEVALARFRDWQDARAYMISGALDWLRGDDSWLELVNLTWPNDHEPAWRLAASDVPRLEREPLL